MGGPTYYMKKALKQEVRHNFSLIFAFALMIEIVPSIMVQGHSAASTMKDTFNVPMAVSGVILAVLAALVVLAV